MLATKRTVKLNACKKIHASLLAGRGGLGEAHLDIYIYGYTMVWVPGVFLIEIGVGLGNISLPMSDTLYKQKWIEVFCRSLHQSSPVRRISLSSQPATSPGNQGINFECWFPKLIPLIFLVKYNRNVDWGIKESTFQYQASPASPGSQPRQLSQPSQPHPQGIKESTLNVDSQSWFHWCSLWN